jgi:hypothetical protein
MSRRRRFAYLGTAVAILTLCFAVSRPEPAGAMPEFQTFCFYFSDASHNTLVGSCIYACTGASCSGTKTTYSECHQGTRCGLPPPICSSSPWCNPDVELCCCEIYGFPCPIV